ncbi:hypothetical protein AAVH_39063, partial [Aphelenchoides avenae]
SFEDSTSRRTSEESWSGCNKDSYKRRARWHWTAVPSLIPFWVAASAKDDSQSKDAEKKTSIPINYAGTPTDSSTAQPSQKSMRLPPSTDQFTCFVWHRYPDLVDDAGNLSPKADVTQLMREFTTLPLSTQLYYFDMAQQEWYRRRSLQRAQDQSRPEGFSHSTMTFHMGPTGIFGGILGEEIGGGFFGA